MQKELEGNLLIWKKMEEKVFNWSEVHLSKVTFYKIHILNIDETNLSLCDCHAILESTISYLKTGFVLTSMHTTVRT